MPAAVDLVELGGERLDSGGMVADLVRQGLDGLLCVANLDLVALAAKRPVVLGDEVACGSESGGGGVEPRVPVSWA